MAQQLTVIGNPMLCGTCGDEASVMLRQFTGEDGNEILYCDACWLAARRAYTPLVAHDIAEALAGLAGPASSGNGSDMAGVS